MPYKVTKASSGGYDIKKKSGEKVGHSDSKAKAEASVRARNAGAHGWKGTKKKG